MHKKGKILFVKKKNKKINTLLQTKGVLNLIKAMYLLWFRGHRHDCKDKRKKI
jgi:hypothetical protein